MVAWSGEVPFGELRGENDSIPIHGFAVCQYDSGQIYRFTCDKAWSVVQDFDHESEEAAKDEIPAQYDSSRIAWQRFLQVS